MDDEQLEFFDLPDVSPAVEQSRQNRSSAVMQQRHEDADSLDDFPTPPWATRAVCEFIASLPCNADRQDPLSAFVASEPAANRGYMARPLAEYFGSVMASDVHDYGAGFPVRDFLEGEVPQTDWTISNPPFRLAEAFIQRALDTSRQGVAMILRSAILEGAGRYRAIYAKTPPTDILQFSERVIMQKGVLLDPDVAIPHKLKSGEIVIRKPSTATAYCWLIWDHQATHEGTRFHWVPPSRRSLQRPGDYPIHPYIAFGTMPPYC